MKRQQIKELQEVLTHAMNRDTARLAALHKEITRLHEAEAALGETAILELPQDQSIAEMRCFENWSKWADSKVRDIHKARDDLKAQAQEARQVLVQSFGRTEAVSDLLGKADRRALCDQRRKAEQNGQVPDR